MHSHKAIRIAKGDSRSPAKQAAAKIGVTPSDSLRVAGSYDFQVCQGFDVHVINLTNTEGATSGG